MRCFFCLLLVFFLASYTSVDHSDHETHVVPLPAMRSVKVKKLTLTHTEFQLTPGFVSGPVIQTGQKIRVVYGADYDSVYLYELDTLVSVFRAHDYNVFGEVKLYDRNGNLKLVEHMNDNIVVNDELDNTYYLQVFKAVRHGKSESFSPDGKPGSITWYRMGKNDTFEKIWYNTGNLYAYKHIDTQRYFYEDGRLEIMSHLIKRGGSVIHVKYTYWPNGKIKSETYFEDAYESYPTHIWKYYNEKGKLVKRIDKNSKEPRVLNDYENNSYVISVDRKKCDLPVLLHDSIKNVLGRIHVTNEGSCIVRFSLSQYGARLISVDGVGKYAMEAELSKMFAGLQCYSELHHYHNGKDFYTLELQISE